jgi:hypothetical protein
MFFPSKLVDNKYRDNEMGLLTSASLPAYRLQGQTASMPLSEMGNDPQLDAVNPGALAQKKR